MDKHKVEELEKALLGLVLVDKNAVNKVRGFILPEDFFNKNNRIVFQAITDLLDDGYELELAPLIEKLKQDKKFEKIGGHNFISELTEEAGLLSNVNKYIKTITEKSQLRKVAKIIDELSDEIKKDDTSSDALLDKVEQQILSTTRDVQAKDFQGSKDIVAESLHQLEQKAAHEGVTGLSSELPALDDMTSGFQKGDLIILAARPSMGKTAFALNIAANVAKNHTVALFSLEMPATALINRVISFTGFVSGSKLREPSKLSSSEWTKVHMASESVAKLNLYIDDSAGLKLAELVWKAKKLHKNKGLDMIVIDYLQLLSVGNGAADNRQAEVSQISRQLKQLARELDIPVIALSQLSRKVEQRENKTPMMSDLRESGAIEQDADIIAFLYREAYYNKEKADDSSHQVTDIIIAKHRNGAVGTISLTFNPQIGLFTDTEKK